MKWIKELLVLLGIFLIGVIIYSILTKLSLSTLNGVGLLCFVIIIILIKFGVLK